MFGRARAAYEAVSMLILSNEADLTEDQVRDGLRGLDYLLDKAEELEHRLMED